MRRVALVLFLFAACSHSSAKPVNGPDGSHDWWAIDCSHSETNCFERAGEVCPSGYDTSYASGNHEQNSMAVALGNDTAIYHGKMLIRCR